MGDSPRWFCGPDLQGPPCPGAAWARGHEPHDGRSSHTGTGRFGAVRADDERPGPSARDGSRGRRTTRVSARWSLRGVKDSHARISAKRLLLQTRAAGYTGSDRNFRRLVAQEKKAWRAGEGAVRRPAVWSPSEHLSSTGA